MDVLTQAVLTAISGLIIGVPSYFYGRRNSNATASKTEADAIKILGEVVANLAAQLLVAHNEMPIWMAKIAEVEKQAEHWQEESVKLQKDLTVCEGREPLGIETANMLRIEAESIIENISHMSFVPTGEPTEDDLSAIRRLKEIRESAKRMQAST